MTDTESSAATYSNRVRIIGCGRVGMASAYALIQSSFVRESVLVGRVNFARRLKTLKGLTPYEFICKTWTNEPQQFIVDPIDQVPGLDI